MKGLATCVVLGLLVLGMVAWWWGNRPGEPVAAVPPGPAGVESAAVEDTGLRVGVSEESSPDTRREALPPVTSGEPAPLFGDAQTLPFTFTGRVVDATRRPVVGALLSLAGGAGTVGTSTSGADGRFEWTVDLPLELLPLVLTARDGAGHADRHSFFAPPPGGLMMGMEAAFQSRRADAGTLVLRESHDLVVRVRQENLPVAEVRIESEYGHMRQLGPFARTDGEGRALLQGLPRGVVHVVAKTAGGVALGRAFVPEDAGIDLELVEVPVRTVLVVDRDSGRPIAGARVTVSEWVRRPLPLPEEQSPTVFGEAVAPRELVAHRTGEDGWARFEGLHPDLPLRLRVEAEGYASQPAFGYSSVPLVAGAEPTRIELEPQPGRQVRWPLADGEVPAPAVGTEIRFEAPPGSWPGAVAQEDFYGVVQAGELVATIAGPIGHWRAITPEGAWARVSVPRGEIGSEVTFHHPRRLTVELRERDGSPAVGISVSLRNQGNNQIAPPARTDASGRAVFEGLERILVSVRAARATHTVGQVVGQVDLARGDGSIEATLAGRARGEFLTRIEGRPELPPTWSVRALGDAGRVVVLAEHPEAGSFEAEIDDLDPGQSVALRLEAPGFLPARIDTIVPSDGGPITGTFELAPFAVWEVHITGERAATVQVVPERWDAERETWQAPPGYRIGQGARLPNGPRGSFVFGGLEPGRWRGFDRESSTPSDVVDLEPGALRGRVLLDLDAPAFASGSVELPDAAELVHTRILVRGGEEGTRPPTDLPGQAPPEGFVPRDGHFRVPVPRDAEVELVPWHPWLMPAADGTARVRGGTDGLVLRLVEGNVLTLDISSHPELARVRELRVARFAPGASDPPSAAPLEWHHAPVVDGNPRCHLPFGTWDLWIDPGQHFRPLLLRGIEVRGSFQRAVAFERGSSIRLRVLVPTGQDPPRVYLGATHSGAIEYRRTLNSGGEALVELPGLGPGAFRLHYGSITDLTNIRTLDLDLDGESPFELELDLR